MGLQRNPRAISGRFPGWESAQRALGPLQLPRVPVCPLAVGVWDRACKTTPPVPFGSQAAPPPPPRSSALHTAAPARLQLLGGLAACTCDLEAAMPWPKTPSPGRPHSHTPSCMALGCCSGHLRGVRGASDSSAGFSVLLTCSHLSCLTCFCTVIGLYAFGGCWQSCCCRTSRNVRYSYWSKGFVESERL